MSTEQLTVLHFLQHRARSGDTRSGLAFADGNEYRFAGWAEFAGDVWRAAAGLNAYGVGKGSTVGILLPSSLNWERAHLASLAAGAVVVGLDPHDPAEKMEHIIGRAGINVLFLKDENWPRALSGVSRSHFHLVAHFGQQEFCGTLVTWHNLCSTGSGRPDPALPLPEDRATIIFTSGTTKDPKAISYDHRQLAFAVETIAAAWSSLDENVRTVCWLPLSNLFQRIVNLVALRRGCSIYFVEDPLKLLEQLPAINPHFLIAVPRFYEKLYAGIQNYIASAPLPVSWALNQAVQLGRRHAAAELRGESLNAVQNALLSAADACIFRRMRARLGNDLRFLISGSAPLSTGILEFFQSIRLPIFEAYGLSENIVPVAMNLPHAFRLGSVGRPLLAGSVRTSPANEILVRGPGLFSGYLGEDGECTRLTVDGFYRTGDFGYVDDQGFIFVGGREADIIKTSTGRRISPLPIEARLKEIPGIDQVVVMGQSRKCLCALLSVDWKAFSRKAPAGAEDSRAAQQQMQSALANSIAPLAAHERPAGFLLLRSGFSIAGGELTSNLKLKRERIAEKYSGVIDRLYREMEQQSGLAPRVWFLSTADLRMAELSAMPVLKRLQTNAAQRLLSAAETAAKVSLVRVRGAAARMARTPAAGEALRAESIARIAEVLREELGPLKGPLAKIGQMLSYLDKDLPAPVQQALSSLQDSTPPLDGKLIRQIVAAELGKPVETLFAEWSDTPLAAASISQLHLARLHSGQQVIVKVKYPGIEKVVRSDLLILRLLLPLLRPLLRVSNLRELHAELRTLILAECDFRREAVYQQEFRRLFAGNPDIIIPAVISDYSTHCLLTMEYVDGQKFREFQLTANQEEKNRAGRIIFEFVCTAINRFSIFNADPHPGNYLFADGKVCILDFGFIKEWPPAFMQLWKEQSLAAYANDLQQFAEVNCRLNFGGGKHKFNHEALLALYRRTLYLPWLEDRPFRFTREFGREQVRAIAAATLCGTMRFPAEFLAVSRLFWGKYALMAELEAEANWHRIVLPLLREKALERRSPA